MCLCEFPISARFPVHGTCAGAASLQRCQVEFQVAIWATALLVLRLCKRRPGCDPAVTRLCSRVVEKLQTFCPESMRIQSKKLKIWRNTLKSSEKDADACRCCKALLLVRLPRRLQIWRAKPRYSAHGPPSFRCVQCALSPHLFRWKSSKLLCLPMSLHVTYPSWTLIIHETGFGWARPLSVVPFWILWWNALTVRYCHFVTVIICAYLCFVAKSTARGITKHIHSKHSGDPKAGGAAKLDPNPQVQSMQRCNDVVIAPLSEIDTSHRLSVTGSHFDEYGKCHANIFKAAKSKCNIYIYNINVMYYVTIIYYINLCQYISMHMLRQWPLWEMRWPDLGTSQTRMVAMWSAYHK